MQNNDKSISIRDKKFSDQLLDLSTLKKCVVETDKFGKLVRAHGPFIQDDTGNTLFDLRLYGSKPFWGHGHPLEIKFSLLPNYRELRDNFNQLPKKNISLVDHTNFKNFNAKSDIIIQKNLLFTSGAKLNYLPLSNASQYYIELLPGLFIDLNDPASYSELDSFIKYINTVLINGNRVVDIQNKLKNAFSKFSISGLLMEIDTNCENIEQLAISHGIYISDTNLHKGKIYLELPTSFTNSQLDDLLVRLNNFIGEL